MIPNSAAERTRILVVDDERLIADTIVAILRQDGFEAIAAYSGNQAIEEATTYRPDIMLSDFYMPDINGLEAARLVRGLCPNVKVFLLSGQASALDLLSDPEQHEFDYQLLAKPIHPDVLLAKIRQ